MTEIMQITFHEKTRISAEKMADCVGKAEPAGCDGAGKLRYVLNDGSVYENRSCVLENDAFQFDGYSTWFEETGKVWQPEGDFSISLFLAPQEYSDEGDGLYFRFDRKRRSGFYIRLHKHGKIETGFGNGKELFSFSSIRSHVKKCVWNLVTVIFRKEAGWCDLYVNGVLSNRKQFPRYMALAWPEGGAVLGKYFPEEFSAEMQGGCPVDASGVFCGLMQCAIFQEDALGDEEVQELAACFPCGKETGSLLLDRSTYGKDAQRPQFHLIPPGKWMNEPHAPVWYEGNYHIFYQANPHAPSWNHIQWGHMISRDMIHWRDLPLALETQENGPDPDGCWSGSALIDRDGSPRIYYTAGNNRKFPNQAVTMAVPVPGDRQLKCWHKREQPVQEQTEGWRGEFRDPFVWLEQRTYYMLVGTGDENNKGGNAVLYSSPDGIAWISHGFLLDYEYEKNREVGHVWELPVLLPLRDEHGTVCCHILLLCACQIENDVVETYYFLGHWDCEGKSFRKFHEKAMLLDLGKGTFTGPSGFVTPDGRSVIFSIAQGKRTHEEEIRAGWAHNGGLPMELFIRDGKLCVRPVREVMTLKGKKLLELENMTANEANSYLEKLHGNRFLLELVTRQENSGIEVCCGKKKVKMLYCGGKGRFQAEDEAGTILSKYRGWEDEVHLEDEKGEVRWEYYLDHSMIEACLNERKLMTLRNYVDGVERVLRLTETDGKLLRLTLWEMESAY